MSDGRPRVPGRLPEFAQALDAFHAAIDEGVRRFDHAEYWHAHESWETAWKSDHGGDRHYLKGLIQYAAALHHLRRGNPSPAARLLESARGHLSSHQGPRWPFDSSALLRQLDRVAQRLRAGAVPEWPKIAPFYRVRTS